MSKTHKKTRDQWLRTAYTKHIDHIVSYLRKIIGDTETAKDLAHDAFLRIYNSKNFDPENTSKDGYLFIAARNLALTQKKNLSTRNNGP